MEKIYANVKKQQESKKSIPLSVSDVVDLTSKEPEEKSTQKCCNM